MSLQPDTGHGRAAAAPGGMNPAIRFTLRLLALLWVVMMATWLLAGCGGGGDPATDDPTPHVNRALQPVVCK